MTSMPAPRCGRVIRAAALTLVAAAATWPAAATAQGLPDDLAGGLIVDMLWADGSVVRFAPGDSAVLPALRGQLGAGRETVEAYFGEAFPAPFTVTIAPSRDAFSAILGLEWGMSQTACWMVGAGVSDFLILLSPRVWATEACEHDPEDARHIQDIITHELTHVYHGQRNPSDDFAGAEGLAWFIEGLAVQVAGQLDRDRLSDPAEAVKAGAIPTQLEDAWSGEYRYGVSGSLVRFIDERFGREVIVRMLPLTTEEEVLSLLGWSEAELLENWTAWVRAR